MMFCLKSKLLYIMIKNKDYYKYSSLTFLVLITSYRRHKIMGTKG